MRSSPMQARPWYADMKRLYPLMWVEVLNGGRLDLTVLARAFHSSCSSWLRFLHSWSPL